MYQNGNGCVQCSNSYFQFSRDYPCMQCQEIFGNQCLHCTSGTPNGEHNGGCQQCISNDYYRDNIIDVGNNNLSYYYCKESKCSYNNMQITHCSVCNNEKCSQCINGYFKINDLCLDCFNSSVTGNNCLHCSDNNGCQQCDTTTQRVLKINENNGLSYYQCVQPSIRMFFVLLFVVCVW